MKKILAAIIAVLASTMPALAHEIGMQHVHKTPLEIIVFGVIVVVGIVAFMIYKIKEASRQTDKNDGH